MGRVLRVRAGIILIQDDAIALIKRERASRTFYVIPGGGVDKSESTEQAAKREAKEELGLDIEVKQLIAILALYEGNEHRLQLYFEARAVGGVFGEGTGDEMKGLRDASRGTYAAIWMPLSDLQHHEVYPKPLIDSLCANEVGKGIKYFVAESQYPSQA